MSNYAMPVCLFVCLSVWVSAPRHVLSRQGPGSVPLGKVENDSAKGMLLSNIEVAPLHCDTLDDGAAERENMEVGSLRHFY